MKNILITGATDGIGKETARQLAEKGYRIIIHGRSANRTQKVLEELNMINSQANHKIALADLESQKQVLELSINLKEAEDKIDVLINNAALHKQELELNEAGIEKTIAVNYHSHFILTLLLIPLLEKSEDKRIINLASMAHSDNIDLDRVWNPDNYEGSQAYYDSKLAMLLFTFKLAKILDDYDVNTLHPGAISTKLLHQVWGAGGDSVKKGAETPVFLATSDRVKGESGHFFVDKKKKEATAAAYDQDLQEELWDQSIRKIKYQEILDKIPDRLI
ncbi:SDR family NAD(P)-dependent oxidoreductase [Halanaerobium hydrogeniformans]|uniref:Short-chain dehydrogenase/reductase SDR n=1 Tax=Halanaerobium hydrogeniformans TaxID=656519 RepID=E4RNQ7_HALHG|nr:SDR family NAD(P)-dependent oxidoreductase [Halanaerobium hydrogeniformans]ADQ13735.1 short-chain dehydrogenase/reductase SDR [Halanaerobium hydrogeniformans]